MEVLKFGFGYWKKNLPMAILVQLCSYIAIICDLMLPLISEMFIDYVILDHSADTSDNIFAFMLSCTSLQFCILRYLRSSRRENFKIAAGSSSIHLLFF